MISKMTRSFKTFLLGSALSVLPIAVQTQTLSTEKNAKTESKQASRTGIIFVRSIEDKSSTAYSYFNASSHYQAGLIQKTFAELDAPVIVIGKKDDSISIDAITDAFDSMAQKDIDHIVLINDMHGNLQYDTTGNIFTSLTELMYKNDGSAFTSDSLYKAIGERFEKNKGLKNKDLFVLQSTCNSMASLPSFHHLPAKTKIFCYSPYNSVMHFAPYQTQFVNGYETLLSFRKEKDNKPLPLTDKTIYAAAILGGNIDFKNNTNAFYFIQIAENKADTLFKNGQGFSLPSHQGFIPETDPIKKQLFILDMKDEQIDEALKEFDELVPSAERRKAIKEYRALAYDFSYWNKMSGKTWDIINFVTTTLALKHPELLQSTTQYALDNELIGPVTKPPIPQPK